MWTSDSRMVERPLESRRRLPQIIVRRALAGLLALPSFRVPGSSRSSKAAFDEREEPGTRKLGRASKPAKALRTMICGSLRRDSSGRSTIRESLVHIDSRRMPRLTAAEVELARLPNVQSFVLELRCETGRVGCGIKRFGRENASRLMVAMLAGHGSGIHGDHYLRPKRANQADEPLKRSLPAPFLKGRIH